MICMGGLRGVDPLFNNWWCSKSPLWGISSHPQPDAPFLARNILAKLHPNPLITSLDNVNWLVQPLGHFPPAIWLFAFIFQICITAVINRWILPDDDTNERLVPHRRIWTMWYSLNIRKLYTKWKPSFYTFWICKKIPGFNVLRIYNTEYLPKQCMFYHIWAIS